MRTAVLLRRAMSTTVYSETCADAWADMNHVRPSAIHPVCNGFNRKCPLSAIASSDFICLSAAVGCLCSWLVIPCKALRRSDLLLGALLIAKYRQQFAQLHLHTEGRASSDLLGEARYCSINWRARGRSRPARMRTEAPSASATPCFGSAAAPARTACVMSPQRWRRR